MAGPRNNPFADIEAEEQAAKGTGAPPPGVNPYKPGSEEADWFNRQPKPQAATVAAPQLSGSFDPMTGAPIGGNPYGDLPAAGFTPPAPPPKEEYRGSVLPFTRDTRGGVNFTPLTAGPIGSMYEAAQLPGRVASGEVKVDTADPNFMGQVLGLAANFNPANPMIRSGSGVIPGARMAPREVAAGENVREGLNVLGFGPGGRRKPQTPSEEALRAVGNDQHAAFRGMDIPYNPAYMGVLSQDIEQKLVDAGVHPEHAKGLYKTIRGLRDYTPKSDDPNAVITLSPSNVMAIRDSIKNHFDAGPAPKNNQHGVGVAYRAFEDFLERPPAEAILGRSPTGARAVGAAGAQSNLENEIAAAAGAGIFKRGRANLSAMHRSEDIGAIDEAAGLRNASANSGNNLGNSVRSRVTSMLLSPRRMLGFNEAEEAALRAVPEGSTGRNVGRTVGNLLGGGGGIGTQAVGWGTGALANYLGLGTGASTAVGFGVPAFGMWLKNRMGQSTADALRDVATQTRQRSPLFLETPFKERVADPTLTLSPRDRVARQILRVGVTPDGQPIPLDPQGNQVRPAWEER
jgi:hypothetical protein